MRAYERLLRYAAVDTQSREGAETVPSTEKQYAFAWLLRNELQDLGMTRVYTDPHAYTYAFLPASPGMENEPVIGLIAHIDTSPAFSGEGVRPLLHRRYSGKAIKLGRSGRVLSPEDFPDLKRAVGKTLITTDGTTLLGADDKAGVAEIMTVCERLIRSGRPHCAVAVCFTPDEEIGHGANLLELERFGADFAYTVDGGPAEEINFETFNAASASFLIHGVSVHPGSAKGVMVNASLLAMSINAMLPKKEIPSQTEGHEGFYHLIEMRGDVQEAELRYIIRDHDAERFQVRCDRLWAIEHAINAEYGPGTAVLSVKQQYRNMAEILAGHMEIVERAENAIRLAGLNPVRAAVRGGTDGAQLSFRGLPCPNLGTGGYAFHGPGEHIAAEDMDTVVEILLNIVCAKEKEE
ncbi:MAG: peptidase T [Oscillospiraceae bacterium]|nr:peptidase T [Oscillospiraceae bacterium]